MYLNLFKYLLHLRDYSFLNNCSLKLHTYLELFGGSEQWSCLVQSKMNIWS